VKTDHAAFKEAEKDVHGIVAKLMNVNGTKTVDEFHREYGKIMWEYVGMGRNKAGLEKALVELPKVREAFWKDVKLTGSENDINTELEKAQRVADFLELGELMARDALHREESCGGHFREEYQTDEGEAKRDDERFAYVAAWEFKGVGVAPELHKENLEFEYVKPSQRSYK